MRLEVFTTLVAERLSVAGEFSDAEICYHKARGVEVSGWSLDDEGACFICSSPTTEARVRRPR